MTRYSPYNYAYNNPVSFIDPDGRKPQTQDAVDESVMYPKSLWSFYAGGGSLNNDAVLDFLAQNNGWGAFQNLANPKGGFGSEEGNGTFGETQAFRDIMAAFYFSGIDFSYPPDDHFNQFGQFLYTDDKKSNNIVIDYILYGKSFSNDFNLKDPVFFSTQLKDMDFNSSNLSTLANIAAYYAKSAGINTNKLFNKSFSVGAFNNVYYWGGIANGTPQSYNGGKFWGQTDDGSQAIMHAEPSLQRVTINVYNGKVSSLINDKYNFISVLGHEGGPQGHNGLPNVKHTQIYQNQKSAPLYRYTTPEFKAHTEENYNFYKLHGN